MKHKVLIASDSTSDLGGELIERYGIQILPLGVALGERRFTDGVDITPDDIYANYEATRTLPKTSAINMASAEDFFGKWVGEGYSIVFFTISAQMSSTYQNVHLAAGEFEDVHIVDTQNLSTGGGLLVIRAAELAKEGRSAAEIAAHCRDLVSQIDASFVIDSLEFLHKGGRCSALAAFGANLLKLKPCIVVKEGKMSVGGKYRGRFADVLLKYIDERIGTGEDIEEAHVFVTHAGCDPEIVKACVDRVRERMPNAGEIHITRAGCTISSHCGKNTLGVLFVHKKG